MWGCCGYVQKLASACLSEGASDYDKSRQEFPAVGTPKLLRRPLLPGILGATWSILTFRQASTEHRKHPDRLPECVLSTSNPTEMGPLECTDTPYDEKVRNRMQKLGKTHPSRYHRNASTARISNDAPSSPRCIVMQREAPP